MRQFSFCFRKTAYTSLLGATAITLCATSALAHDDPPPSPFTQQYPDEDARRGGVVAESFRYHHGVTGRIGVFEAGPAPAGGWYGYGFPVETHRWGWFGAGRYYPRVVWHRGYYGDCCRWGYRRGY